MCIYIYIYIERERERERERDIAGERGAPPRAARELLKVLVMA